MSNIELNNAASLEILNKITNDLTKDEIINLIEEYKSTYTEELNKNTLWRTPIKKIHFLLIVFILIASTILKFSLIKFLNWDSQKKAANGIYYDYVDIIVYSLWIILPPLYFLYEYIYLFGKDQKNRLDTLQREDIKYCQDLAGRIWAALAVFFSILLAIKYDLAIKA